jgi:hypothetical protein
MEYHALTIKTSESLKKEANYLENNGACEKYIYMRYRSLEGNQ